jgi:hypothetical protein
MSLRHVPAGRGHPYERDPDQRVPVRPVLGDVVELRVTAPADVAAVELELADGRLVTAVCRGAAAPDDDRRFGQTAGASGEGHLTDASAYDGGGRR